MLFNSITPKSFGDLDEEEAYKLAASARLKTVSVYLPTRVKLSDHTAAYVLQNCFYMQMVSSSLALHLHFGDESRKYGELHRLFSESVKSDDGTKDFSDVFPTH